MTKHFSEYLWKGGIPYGIQPIDGDNLEQDSYKITMDPYRKRISIEKYKAGHFVTCIYDSVLLDFRHLKASVHAAWEKTTLSESPSETVCLIRNQDDRAVFIEKHLFEKGLCRECHVTSTQGVPLSIHRMSYISLGDLFNGVTLYDANAHKVMCKVYEIDADTGEFTKLINEAWEV